MVRYECAICGIRVSPRFLLCSNCAKEHAEKAPWLTFLKSEENSKRLRDWKLQRDGISVMPMSPLNSVAIEHGTQVA